MLRRTLFKILMVCFAVAFTWLLLRPGTTDLVTALPTEKAHRLNERLTNLPVHTYDRAGVALYNDRGYHTETLVRRLVGLRFTPIARNEVRPYVLMVERTTALFTLANRNDLRGLNDWTALPDTVLVDDAYAPRKLDVLLERRVEPGSYVVRNPGGGPSRPVFFDPTVVTVVP